MLCCAGQVGFLQTQVLGCLGCLWFDRTEVSLYLIEAITLCFVVVVSFVPPKNEFTFNLN